MILDPYNIGDDGYEISSLYFDSIDDRDFNQKLDGIIFDFKNKYDCTEIVIASMDESYFRDDCQKFIFKKSDHSSKKFLKLMRESSLVVCSDSGPLHIALALKKDLLAFMISTDPEIVINTGSCVIIQ